MASSNSVSVSFRNVPGSTIGTFNAAVQQVVDSPEGKVGFIKKWKKSLKVIKRPHSRFFQAYDVDLVSAVLSEQGCLAS